MAWTAPRTWTTSELVTAAIMNTHVRDNLLETAVAKVTTLDDIVKGTATNTLARVGSGLLSGGVLNWKYVVKTSETSAVNNTLANDPHLLFAIAANEIWLVEAILIAVSSSVTPDFKFGFTVPVGSIYASEDFVVADTAGAFSAGPGGAGGAANVGLPTSTPAIISVRFYVVAGANAGNFQLQWAQNTTNAIATILRQGSMLKCYKIA